MKGISTHILDTTNGRPASGVPVKLEARGAYERWRELAHGETDRDGRIQNLLPPDFSLEARVYRLCFDTGGYFALQGVETFYPQVLIIFDVRDTEQHYHVPLLLSPYGYSTYRGS